MKKLILSFSVLLLTNSCEHSKPDDSDVKDAARTVIIHELKDPSSAEFHHNEIIKSLGDNTFEYIETISAKNSFGGSIAQNAVVKVKWSGGNPSEVSNWLKVDLQMRAR